MESKKRGYDLLLEKLDRFIRKYYVNKLIRGALYSIGLILALFLLFNLLEYYYYFGQGVRKVLFGSFIFTSLIALGYWVIFPLINFIGLGNVISHEQAAKIVGDHFPDVKDKLLNVLQLKKNPDTSTSAALLAASIEQKTETIKLVPFQSAIDLTLNKKYLKYALPPFLLLLVILFAAPSLITDSTSRIINNNKDFEREAPFTLTFGEENPEVLQYEDYTIKVSSEGEVLPADAYIEVNNFQYKLKNEGPGKFSYTIRNIQSDTPIRVYSGALASTSTTIKVLAKPNISDLSIALDYPSYTGRKDETLINVGNISAPEGTVARWVIGTKNAESVQVAFGGKPQDADRRSTDEFTYKKSLRSSTPYTLYYQNKNITSPDSMSYAIHIQKDDYPAIEVKEFKDSLQKDVKYFAGTASDDYGLNGIFFKYQIIKENGTKTPLESQAIKKTSGREAQYNYTFDISTLQLAPGENVSYYFEVFDNDRVNGSKSTKSSVMVYEKPSVEEFEKLEEQNSEEIKEDLKKSIDNIKKIQEKYEEMRQDLLQKNDLDWQDKEELQKLLDEQKKIQDKLEQAKEKFDQNLENQKEFNQQNEEMQEKQEKMQELFEEAMDPEKQDLLDKIEELLQELEKENSLEMMEQMDQNNEKMENDMNRLLELYKQLEVEKEAQDIMKKLEELAEKQEALAKETEENKKPSDQLQKEQEELNKEMEKLQEDMKKLEEKNEELQRPKDLGEENEEKMEDIQEDMQKSQDQMQQQDNQGASKSQKKAAQKMKEMASGMSQSMSGGDQDAQKEDAKLLRQILENLVTISFEQEETADQVQITSTITPKYTALVQNQFKIKDDFVLVEDSLVALANRNDQIQGFVLDKVSEVKSHMKGSLEKLEERKTKDAINDQRRSMTAVNDLALMLSEALENMQQSMSQSMPGSQMCNKPGNNPGSKPGKVPSDKISESSEGLGKKLQDMMGKQQKSGKNGNSAKDFAEAAARQAAMRKALQDMQEKAKEQGQGSQELEQLIEEMNKIEIDLVNKRLDGELLKRQQNITTRLLEAEKAERKREYDNKRKGETAVEIKREMPPSLKEYLKKREAEIEIYKTVAPELRPYYKSLVDEYYKALKKVD